MAQINAAFETLIDPVRRMEYDIGQGMASAREPDATHSARAERPRVALLLLEHRLSAHRTPIYGLSFAPDSGRLLSMSFDNELIWWSDRFQPARRVRIEGCGASAVRALTGERAVAAGYSDHGYSIWRVRGGEVEACRQGELAMGCCVSISEDGQRVAMGSVDRSLRALCPTGRILFKDTRHMESVTAAAWSPTSDLLATGGADASVRLWMRNGRHYRVIEQLRSTVTAIAFSPNARRIAVAAVDLSVRIFEAPTYKLAKVLFGHERCIESLAFHPNSNLLASAGRDGMIGIYDADKGVGHGRIEASHLPLHAVAFSPDGRRLAAGGLDRLVRVWALRTAP